MITIVRRTREQKTQRKFYCVQDKVSWEKGYEFSSDRTMRGKKSFSSSVISQRSSDEGKKKILFLKLKYHNELTEFTDSPDENDRTKESLPEKLRTELEMYIEKICKADSSPPPKKSLLTRGMYKIFQLCAGLTLQRNQTIKTQQLCLLYFLLYHFPIQVEDIATRQFTKQRFFKYVDENKDALSSSARNDFEEDFAIIQYIAESFYSQVPYLNSSKGEQIYSIINLKRFINEDMLETYQKMNWKRRYTVVDFYWDRKTYEENFCDESIEQSSKKEVREKNYGQNK